MSPEEDISGFLRGGEGGEEEEEEEEEVADVFVGTKDDGDEEEAGASEALCSACATAEPPYSSDAPTPWLSCDCSPVITGISICPKGVDMTLAKISYWYDVR